MLVFVLSGLNVFFFLCFAQFRIHRRLLVKMRAQRDARKGEQGDRASARANGGARPARRSARRRRRRGRCCHPSGRPTADGGDDEGGGTSTAAATATPSNPDAIQSRLTLQFACRGSWRSRRRTSAARSSRRRCGTTRSSLASKAAAAPRAARRSRRRRRRLQVRRHRVDERQRRGARSGVVGRRALARLARPRRRFGAPQGAACHRRRAPPGANAAPADRRRAAAPCSRESVSSALRPWRGRLAAGPAARRGTGGGRRAAARRTRRARARCTRPQQRAVGRARVPGVQGWWPPAVARTTAAAPLCRACSPTMRRCRWRRCRRARRGRRHRAPPPPPRRRRRPRRRHRPALAVPRRSDRRRTTAANMLPPRPADGYYFADAGDPAGGRACRRHVLGRCRSATAAPSGIQNRVPALLAPASPRSSGSSPLAPPPPPPRRAAAASAAPTLVAAEVRNRR